MRITLPCRPRWPARRSPGPPRAASPPDRKGRPRRLRRPRRVGLPPPPVSRRRLRGDRVTPRIPTQKDVLPNGVTVLIGEDHSSPVVAINLWVRAGYFDEEDREVGISHVIEHMFFKGTPDRPRPDQIATEIKSLGGELNAGTYYDSTNYYVVLPSQNFRKGLETVADALMHPLFDAGELKREIEAVMQEGRRKMDTPGAFALEMMFREAFDTHRIRRWRIGEEQALRAITRDDLLAYFRTHYVPERVILSVVGDVKAADVIEAAHVYLGGMTAQPGAPLGSPAEPAQTGFKYRRIKGDIKRSYIVVGYHTPAVLTDDDPALRILAYVLGSGQASRLYQSVKEKAGLVDSIGASLDSFRDIGILTVMSEGEPKNALAAGRATQGEVERLRREPPAAAEMERARSAIEYRYHQSRSEVLGQSSILAYYEALGDFHLADEQVEKLRLVTGADVLRVARAHLSLENMTLLEYVPEAAEARLPAPDPAARHARRGEPGRVAPPIRLGPGRAARIAPRAAARDDVRRLPRRPIGRGARELGDHAAHAGDDDQGERDPRRAPGGAPDRGARVVDRKADRRGLFRLRPEHPVEARPPGLRHPDGPRPPPGLPPRGDRQGEEPAARRAGEHQGSVAGVHLPALPSGGLRQPSVRAALVRSHGAGAVDEAREPGALAQGDGAAGDHGRRSRRGPGGAGGDRHGRVVDRGLGAGGAWRERSGTARRVGSVGGGRVETAAADRAGDRLPHARAADPRALLARHRPGGDLGSGRAVLRGSARQAGTGVRRARLQLPQDRGRRLHRLPRDVAGGRDGGASRPVPGDRTAASRGSARGGGREGGALCARQPRHRPAGKRPARLPLHRRRGARHRYGGRAGLSRAHRLGWLRRRARRDLALPRSRPLRHGRAARRDRQSLKRSGTRWSRRCLRRGLRVPAWGRGPAPAAPGSVRDSGSA